MLLWLCFTTPESTFFYSFSSIFYFWDILIDAKRPIILNGIEEFAIRGDLVSRSIIINLPMISDESRKREVLFWKDFEALRPRFLSIIYNAISTALKDQDSFSLENQLRMADAWHWISAAETAFGWPRGSTVEAFRRNQLTANKIILDSSGLYSYLQDLALEDWVGTATDLLSKLNAMHSMPNSQNSRDRPWPENPKMLTNKIR